MVVEWGKTNEKLFCLENYKIFIRTAITMSKLFIVLKIK